jgi:drug/metabolite transporter (DMT)-like permease
MPGSNKNHGSRFMVMLAFATVYIVWGSTYFFIRKAMDGFPPLLLGAIRFLLSGFILLGWALLKGEQVFVLKNIKHAAISGVLLLFIGTGAVIWVEQYLPSAVVAIMVSSSPVWFVVLDKRHWAQNFRNKATITGLIIGFAGVMLLFSEKIFSVLSTVGDHAELGGLALLIIGSMSWAGGSLYSKYKSHSSAASVTSAWQMLAAGFAFIPFSFLNAEPQHFHLANVSSGAWFSLFYLVFFGSIAGFSAYVWLLKVRPATQVSTHAYVNPVVAVLLGVFFADENITTIQVVGLIIILASVLMINLARYRKEKAAKMYDEEAIVYDVETT